MSGRPLGRHNDPCPTPLYCYYQNAQNPDFLLKMGITLGFQRIPLVANRSRSVLTFLGVTASRPRSRISAFWWSGTG